MFGNPSSLAGLSRPRRELVLFRRSAQAAILGIILSVTTVFQALPASAHWSATGNGSTTATVGTLAPPTNVSVPARSDSDVAVGWTKSVGHVVPTGYVVTRITSYGSVPACGSSLAAPITGTGCTDISVPEGDHKYQVTAVYRSWTAAAQPSNSVTVSSRRDLYISSQPSASVMAGAKFSLTVQLRTLWEFPLLLGDIPVTVAIGASPGGGSLSGPTRVDTKWTGTATFNDLIITKAGTYTLTVSSPGFAGTVSRSFTVTPAAATQLVVRTPTPVSGVASATANLGPVTVERRDQFGNPAVGTATSINLASDTSANGVFAETVMGPGITSVSIPAGSSSALFYYGAKTAGTTPFTVSGIGTPLPVPVQILPAQASKLEFGKIGFDGVLPKNVHFIVTVSVLDVFGNAVDAPTITTIVQTGAAKCSISGTPQTVSSVHGVATFIGLIHNGQQDDCRLTATSTDLPPKDSATFKFR